MALCRLGVVREHESRGREEMKYERKGAARVGMNVIGKRRSSCVVSLKGDVVRGRKVRKEEKRKETQQRHVRSRDDQMQRQERD